MYSLWRGIIQQRAHTLNPPPYQHCICNQLRFAKLYLWPNPSVRLRGLFIVGQLQPQRVMSLGWQRSVGRVWQDTSAWETGALCNLTSLQLPVRYSTSQGPPPNHSCTAWYLHSCIKCIVHAECHVSFENSSTRRVSRFELLVSRNKILQHIPTNFFDGNCVCMNTFRT